MILKSLKSKILRFKNIFRSHWQTFVDGHPRYDTPYYHSEINKMLSCGSEANGFAVYQCLCCGKGEHKVNFSCKGKACLQCGKRYARDSMMKIARMLYPGVSYRQVVLTMPSQLRVPFYNHPNQSKLYSLFMGLAQPCLEELIQSLFNDTNYKVASIVFLHTNGRQGNYNPHLHVILAEGAFHPQKGIWKTFKRLPLNSLRLLWQKHLLAMIEDEFEKSNGLVSRLWRDNPDGFYAYPGNKKNEKVPTKSYRSLIKYLTKYLSSPPIGVSRIVDYNGATVKYFYQCHRTKTRVYETIDAQTFLGRMVQHILPKGFQRVRYYGLQATATFKKYYEAIVRLTGDLVDIMITYAKRITYAEFFEEVVKRNPLICRLCGTEMDLVRLCHPDRRPSFDLLVSQR